MRNGEGEREKSLTTEFHGVGTECHGVIQSGKVEILID